MEDNHFINLLINLEARINGVVNREDFDSYQEKWHELSNKDKIYVNRERAKKGYIPYE
jgi:molybdate-binding protein